VSWSRFRPSKPPSKIQAYNITARPTYSPKKLVELHDDAAADDDDNQDDNNDE
jgi:hypothetical protein